MSVAIIPCINCLTTGYYYEENDKQEINCACCDSKGFISTDSVMFKLMISNLKNRKEKEIVQYLKEIKENN